MWHGISDSCWRARPMVPSRCCADRVCTVADAQSPRHPTQYYSHDTRQHQLEHLKYKQNPIPARATARERHKERLTSQAYSAGGMSFKRNTPRPSKGWKSVGSDQAAGGLRGRIRMRGVIADTGGRQISRIRLAQVGFRGGYLFTLCFAFFLLPSSTMPPSSLSGVTAAAGSVAGAASGGSVVRRSPRQTIQASAMLCGGVGRGGEGESDGGHGCVSSMSGVRDRRRRSQHRRRSGVL